MKKIHLFCTKIFYYLTEIPLLVIFLLSIPFNDKVEEQLKLYPLQIVLVLGMIFIFVFLFRMIRISNEEIKCIGPFSSRDSAIIKKDRRLVITKKKGASLVIELFGRGDYPALDWVDPEDYKNMETNLFRATAVGGKHAVKTILSYFDVSAEDIESAFEKDSFSAEYDSVSFEAENDGKEYKFSVFFKDTI